MPTKRRGLGRNLEALLGDMANADLKEEAGDAHVRGELRYLSLDRIQQGKYQPRREFDHSTLKELADSIRAQGVIQPIVVRSTNGSDQNENQFEIIAGERRFRAAQMAGLDIIPALVRELPDEAVIAMALIENIQRENLNPIEEAMGLQRLINEFKMTHEQVAKAVSKSRTAVSNLLRLLSLCHEVKQLLEQGKLEMGHARALLSLNYEQQLSAATLITNKGFSVREAEDLVRKMQADILHPSAQKCKLNPELYKLQEELSSALNTHVVIQQNANGRGKLTINYKNQKQLRDILGHMPL